MKTVKLMMTCLFVAGTTLLVAKTLPSNGPLPFATYDSDNNNVITLEEFDAIKKQRMNQKKEEGRLLRNNEYSSKFVDIDKNADGVINQDELKIYQESRYNSRMNQQKKGFKGNW